LLGEHKPKTDKARERVMHRMAPHPPNPVKAKDDGLLTAAQVFTALSEIRPANAILVEESPSNLADLQLIFTSVGRSPNQPLSSPSPAEGSVGTSRRL
jgi:hypothetical protein